MTDLQEQTISPHPWRVDGVELLCDGHEATSRIAELWGTDADAALMAKAPEMFLLLRKLTTPPEDSNLIQRIWEVMFEAQKLIADLQETGVVVKEKE